ncbi:MAG: MotB protein [Pirellulaceae bacterium]|nr:MAG: MotB protein [Pirellulaceae bacterium]
MHEEDEAMGIPEWVVTFGDMMSLLLTFFIMLVSMSEIKEEEKFQAMVESIKRQFGHDLSVESIQPGELRSRTSAFRVLSTTGRAKRKDTHRGGNPIKAPHGDEERVRIIRPGRNTAIGTVIFFDDGSAELTDKAKQALDLEVGELIGKPQKIEIRGHTSQQLAGPGNDPLLAMDLAYRRCRSVMDYLVDKHGIPPERIRLAPAGAGEPMFLSDDPEKMRMNPRVEVFLLEETVSDLIGTADERAQKVVQPDSQANQE